MEPYKPRRTVRTGPEKKIVDAVTEALRRGDWYVFKTHGGEFQSGLPDLYIAHKRYGTRWVEIKYLEKYSFTPAQLDNFPKMTAAGVGIWILTSAEKHELEKLFCPPNWHTFLKW
jgi:hypothetical protein